MGSQLALKSRIRSTESLAKIFNAQEMIASSHIAKARDVALNAKPYTDAIFDAVQALVAHTHITHPIAVKDEKNPRVAVLALTSDRGMAGPYTSSIIRETESLPMISVSSWVIEAWREALSLRVRSSIRFRALSVAVCMAFWRLAVSDAAAVSRHSWIRD